MKRIFINGLNSKVGGGKSILNNYLGLLHKEILDDVYFIVLVPNYAEYKRFNSNSIRIISLPKFLLSSYIYPFIYDFYLNRLLYYNNIDVVFNLADVPIGTKVKQILLFDWPYAVYPDSIVWKLMDFKSFFSRKIKLFYFKKNLKYVSLVLAQTQVMKNRLIDIYNLKNVDVVPNAVSLDNLLNHSMFQFELPLGIKLLYLTHYYPHKNLEIFISVAKRIKFYDLPYKIIITIDKEQSKNAKFFLNEIHRSSLNDVIVNLGSVTMNRVPDLYHQCDGLLMPTLLESFSGTYVEAMFHKIPIFTSNLDFAISVCGNSAFYFDPFDAKSIVDSLDFVFNNNDIKENLVNEGTNILNSSKSWNEVFVMYNNHIYSLFSNY